jgi:hypothetical protein
MGFSSENIPFSHENHGIFITFSPFAARGSAPWNVMFDTFAT